MRDDSNNKNNNNNDEDDDYYTFPRPIHTVAVIGAGAAGLICAKTLIEEGYDVHVYERNSKIGGTWLYTDESSPSYPIPSRGPLVDDPPRESPFVYQTPPTSSMYQSLCTNIPAPVMQYQGELFPLDSPPFPSHVAVLSYLEDFAARSNLSPVIHLSTELAHMKWHAATSQWRLNLVTPTGTAPTTIDFDAVALCNGHYTLPYSPPPPLQAPTIIHSREYRTPTPFIGQSVLVIGDSLSAHDIIRDLEPHVRALHHWTRATVPNDIPNLDAIILATGYLYSFPFLPQYTSSDGKAPDRFTLVTDGKTVHNLRDFLFYNENPTMAILGLPMKVAPWPLCQAQAKVVAKVWAKKVGLRKDDGEMSGKGRDEMKFGIDKEVEYVGRLRAQVGEIPLSDEWIELRKRSMEIRKEILGY